MTSSLDLATKNIMCGSIKLVYALIYTLFLGFALQFGSDLFLLFDPSARRELDTLVARAAAAITITGSYTTDTNGTFNPRVPQTGTFSFTPYTPFIRQNIVKACYRPPTFPWYLQPFPWWTQFIIVPLFSFISSFNNEQPVTLDLFVMVFISCVSFAANKVADHFIFNRSDVVSAIGAFSVGLLGNIYSRKMRGTAFTVMVTGVLFLVPVSRKSITIFVVRVLMSSGSLGYLRPEVSLRRTVPRRLGLRWCLLQLVSRSGCSCLMRLCTCLAVTRTPLYSRSETCSYCVCVHSF